MHITNFILWVSPYKNAHFTWLLWCVQHWWFYHRCAKSSHWCLHGAVLIDHRSSLPFIYRGFIHFRDSWKHNIQYEQVQYWSQVLQFVEMEKGWLPVKSSSIFLSFLKTATLVMSFGAAPVGYTTFCLWALPTTMVAGEFACPVVTWSLSFLAGVW